MERKVEGRGEEQAALDSGWDSLGALAQTWALLKRPFLTVE